MYYPQMSMLNSRYDPATEVSLVAMQPLWDWQDGGTSFDKCMTQFMQFGRP